MTTTPASKLLADAVLTRTYARPLPEGGVEDWNNICDRVLSYLEEVGEFLPEENDLIESQMRDLKGTPAGRILWVGGTDWVKNIENFPGQYNCNNTTIESWEDFRHNCDLLMQGCGVGSLSEIENIRHLPEITNHLDVEVIDDFGEVPKEKRKENTQVYLIPSKHTAFIEVGDSRQGWAVSLQKLLELASSEQPIKKVFIDCSNIRPAGEKIKGFGGVTNPVGLKRLYEATARITNQAVGRKLTPTEVEKILCETAILVIAGNIRRSARIAQGSARDQEFEKAKENLFYQDEEGNYYIDPDKDALRMANFTRLYHSVPDEQVCIEAVRNQYYTNEGAIAWAGEAVARCNADLLDTPDKKKYFLQEYKMAPQFAREYLCGLLGDKVTQGFTKEEELDHRMKRYAANPCFTGDTLVLTKEGHFQIKDLVGKTVTIWDGQEWREIDNFRVTGEDVPVFNVTLKNGQKITATEYHKFILSDGTRKELKDLEAGEVLKAHSQHEDYQHHLTYKSFQVVAIEYSHVADKVYCCTVPVTHSFGLSNGVLTGNCVEIIGSNFFCNLSLVHLGQLNPLDLKEQEEAFRSQALVVCSILHQQFIPEKYRKSRELDPIVGVNFTGGFDFFANLLGSLWLDWWMNDRDRDWDLQDADLDKHPDWRQDYNTIRNLYYAFEPEGITDATLGEMFYSIERGHFNLWRETVDNTVAEYCERRGLRKPNRTTSLQPGGSKSLLSGDSPGWHPPFALSFIRRVQFQKNHPVALACMKAGLNVVPSVDATDENGRLLDDPFDSRVNDWLVEFPIRTRYAETAEQIGFDPVQISALAQFDFAMSVQKHYATHNVSSTIAFREDEIEALGKRIHQAIDQDEGYYSFALMQRWIPDGDNPMARLPYEPTSLEEIKEAEKHINPDIFPEAVQQFYKGVSFDDFQEPKLFCTSQKCELRS